jgi:hypothetical protein
VKLTVAACAQSDWIAGKAKLAKARAAAGRNTFRACFKITLHETNGNIDGD